MAVVVLLGDINVDLLLEIPHYPAEGGEAIATRQKTSLGGSATNTAITLARLGFEARLLGRVGSDAWGATSLADLRLAGVNVDWITEDPTEPTQLNLVTVTPGGERTMFAYRGANARLGPDQVAQSLFDGAALLHLSGYAMLASPQKDAAMAAIQLAWLHKLPVTLDIPAGVVTQIAPCVLDLLGQIDTIMLGKADLHGLGAADPSTLLQAGVRRVIVKRGSDGSSLYEKTLDIHVAGFETTVVDTTGAGDAFAAGLIAGMLAQLDPEECCTIGNALGASAVMRLGAGLSMPGRTELSALSSLSAKLGR